MPDAKLEARMVSLFLSCRALSSPTICRLLRKQSPCPGAGFGFSENLNGNAEPAQAAKVVMGASLPPSCGRFRLRAAKGYALLQHTMQNDQHLVRHRDNGPLLSAAG